MRSTIETLHVEQFFFFKYCLSATNALAAEIDYRDIAVSEIEAVSLNSMLIYLDNIKIDLIEIGLYYVDWIVLAQNKCNWRAVVNVTMKPRFP